MQVLNPKDGHFVLIDRESGQVVERSTEMYKDIPLIGRRERRSLGIRR